jgi:hypothetical protein
MNTREWFDMFTQINKEANYVALTDVDYYAEQIHNLTNEQDYEKAYSIASDMAKMK